MFIKLRYLFRGARLFQEWLVVNFAKVENQRLMYMQNNQKQLRADKYNNLFDDLDDNDRRETVTSTSKGRRIILAPTFIGGHRYMREQRLVG